MCVCVLARKPPPLRKLERSVELVEVDDTWVCVNTMMANKVCDRLLTSLNCDWKVRAALMVQRPLCQVIHACLQKRVLPHLGEYEDILREVPLGRGSRVDFVLQGPAGKRVVLEVKNVTLVDCSEGLDPANPGVSFMFQEGLRARVCVHKCVCLEDLCVLLYIHFVCECFHEYGSE